MRYPILVNIIQPVGHSDGNVSNEITRGVYDFYYENIANFQHMPDNTTLIRFHHPPQAVNVAIEFDEVYIIYGNQTYVDDRFKKEVEEYKKNNFEYFIDRLLKNRGNGDKS